MSNDDFDKKIMELDSLSFLEKEHSGMWRIKGTRVRYQVIFGNIFQWTVIRNPYSEFEWINIDEVLQFVPPNIQERLLFHLDLFR